MFQFQPYHERFIQQNAGKVLRGRIDSFIFTKNSTAYTLKLLGLDKQFKVAGCVSKVPVYEAFTPQLIENIKVNELVDFFDSRIMSLKADGTIDKIKAVYQIN